tara:strand:+ start:939 stop:2141 length:1203 start_codon:yes stop_codon:yes gene_type:complete
MAGRYKAYSEYQDSGVDWPQQMPNHWKRCPLKFLAKIKNGQDYKSVEAEDGYPVMGSGGRFTYASEYMYNRESVLLGRKGTIDKPLYINEPFWTVDTMYYTEIPSDTYGRFVYYLALTIPFGKYSTNTALPSMTQEHLGNNQFVIPSCKKEQKQIARFLDHETGKIDALIEKQQALIALLQEKRQAVISHAVTKGLNPDAKMKDSGVEWLDSLPSHWDLIKMSYILKLQSGDGITSSNIEAVGDYPVYGGNGQRGFTSTYNCEGKYVLIGRQGALCGNVNLAENKFFASEHAVVVYPRISFDTVYLAEMLRFLDLGQYSVSAAQPGVSVERLNMLKVICPPLDEQRCIAKFVTDEIVKFDELSEHSENAITLLQERRTALISAAVTGKIDVRDWEPAPEA